VVSFIPDYPLNTLYALLGSLMRATRLSHLILLDLIALLLVKRTGCETSHYTVFSSFPPLPPT
jgi:hypothetical protein